VVYSKAEADTESKPNSHSSYLGRIIIRLSGATRSFSSIFPTVVFRNHYHNNPSMEEGRKKPLFINNGWGGSGGTRSKKKKREKIDVDVCMYCVCGCVIRILPRQYRRTRFSPLFVVNVVGLFFFYVLLTFFYFYFVFRFNPGSMLFSLLFD
jgi:hypothetical protein